MSGTSEGVKKAWEKRRRGQKNRMLKYWKEYGRPEVEVSLKKGDTLTELAKFYGTTIKQLIKENNITDPAQLTEGLKLKIPALPSRAEREVEKEKKEIEKNNKKKK